MTKTSPSVLAVFFLLLFLCFTQRIGALPVDVDVVPTEERLGQNELREPDTDKTIDQMILDSYGGPEAEKAAEESRLKEEGVETEGMDTLLTPEQAAILHNTPEGGMSKRVLPPFITPWTGGVVPYDLSGLSANYHNMMMEAFREWEKNTCVRFVPAQPQHRYKIVFTDGRGCSSYLGMTHFREQPITLPNGCHTKRIYLHELGHALGLVHVHQLPQRNNYIHVKFDNVEPEYRDQLEIYQASRVPLGQRYRYSPSSIMHYGKYAFSKRPGLQTIFAVHDKSLEDLIGTSQLPDAADIVATNLLYNCFGETTFSQLKSVVAKILKSLGLQVL